LPIATALTFATLASALVSPDPVVAQSLLTFSTAEAAPADSLAYVVTTLDDESDQWALADALLDRAGLGEAIDQAVAEDLTDDEGEALPLDAFLGGEVAIIVDDAAADRAIAESMGGDMDEMLEALGLATPAAVGDEPEPQGFAVVLDARAPDTAWAAIEEAAAEENPEELTYEGTTILYSPASGDEDGMAAARAGDLILFATTPADLHPVIDTIDGRAPSLATLPELATAQGTLPADVLMFGIVNSASLADTNFGPFDVAAGQLATSGITAFSVAADDPGFRLEMVALPAAGESPPVAAANFDSELVRRAPPDSVVFVSAADLGATGTLDAIGAAALGMAFGMDGMGPEPDPDLSPEEAITAQYEGVAQLIGINLQTELFQQLVGEYGFWLAAAIGDGGAPDAASGLFASKVADGDSVAAALMQLSLLAQGATGGESAVTTREVDGDQVYVIADDAGSALEFGVIGDWLVIGDAGAVARLTGEPGESLADSERFQAALGALPAERHGIAYVDLTQAIPLLEAAEDESPEFGFDEMAGAEDASESCANFATQEEAQAAYDAAEPETFDLDQDFDGEVCEDYFVADESAEDVAMSENGEGAAEDDPFADVDLSAFEAFASVSHTGEDGLPRTSAILTIAE
jgi:hypothetical protein